MHHKKILTEAVPKGQPFSFIEDRQNYISEPCATRKHQDINALKLSMQRIDKWFFVASTTIIQKIATKRLGVPVGLGVSL